MQNSQSSWLFRSTGRPFSVYTTHVFLIAAAAGIFGAQYHRHGLNTALFFHLWAALFLIVFMPGNVGSDSLARQLVWTAPAVWWPELLLLGWPCLLSLHILHPFEMIIFREMKITFGYCFGFGIICRNNTEQSNNTQEAKRTTQQASRNETKLWTVSPFGEWCEV